MKNADILNKRESNEKQRRARKGKGEQVIVKERKTGQKRVIDGNEYQNKEREEHCETDIDIEKHVDIERNREEQRGVDRN